MSIQERLPVKETQRAACLTDASLKTELGVEESVGLQAGIRARSSDLEMLARAPETLAEQSSKVKSR